MFNSKYLDDLAKKLFGILPTQFKTIESEVQQRFKDVLELAFSHFDLVTREEFDVQTKVLARTREKLEQLKTQVEVLIAQNNSNDKNSEEQNIKK